MPALVKNPGTNLRGLSSLLALSDGTVHDSETFRKTSRESANLVSLVVLMNKSSAMMTFWELFKTTIMPWRKAIVKQRRTMSSRSACFMQTLL